MFHCCSICLHIPFKIELIFCQVGVKDTKLDFTVLLATKVLNVLLKLLNRWCISGSVRYSTLKTDSMPSLFFVLSSGCKRTRAWWNGKGKHLPEEAIIAPATLTFLHCIVFVFPLNLIRWISFEISYFAVCCFNFFF